MTIKEYLFSKKYGSLRYKLSYFFNHKLPFSDGWNKYNNPLYHWWKARKYFKRPKCHFYKGKITWFFGFPIKKEYLNKILDIRFNALGWKDKWDSPRHEWDPYISIVFFRKWQLLWIFNWISNDKDSGIRSMATWEAILDYLYYGKSIDQCIKNHVWGWKKEITINSNLKKFK